MKSCLCIFNARTPPDAPRTCRFPLATFLQSLNNHDRVMPLRNTHNCHHSRYEPQRALEGLENDVKRLENNSVKMLKETKA